MMQVKIGSRGEVVIPKGIREALGLTAKRKAILTVRGNAIQISAPREDVIKKWRRQARAKGEDVSTWKMGDELYEEVF